MKTLVVAAFLFSLVGAQPALAKKPPSFALWTATWKASDDAAQDKIEAACTKLYGKTNDAKLGPCFVKLFRVSLRERQPIWERAVARISKGQTPACKNAIHVYWLASRKAQKASLIYLDTHPKRGITAISADLSKEPYATLRALTEESKSRSIRICG
jgi:hypothetical protein